MKHGIIVVAVCTQLAVATGALAALAPLEITTLKNGLRVVLAPDPGAQAADVAVWYATGSRFEKPGRSGITHLFERLMFHGTEAAGADDYRRLLQSEGATLNTLTTPDYTSFFATVPASAVELALRLEAERMSKLRITAADVETERAFVLGERRMFLEMNPVGRGVEKLYAAAFPGHGYSRPVIGVEADLSRITLDDALEYYRDHYGPGNAVLTVVGRFEPRATLAAIRRHFDPLPRRGTVVSRTSPPGAPEPRAADRISGSTPLLVAGWRAPVSSDPSSPALDLLVRVLSTNAQGPLGGNRFVQTRVGFDARREGSIFYTVSMTRPESDSSAAERDMVQAIESLTSTPIPAENLDRAKKELQLKWLMDQQTVRGRARALGEALLVDGDLRSVERRMDAIRNLTADDLMAVAQKVFRPEGRTVVWLMPSGSATPATLDEGDAR